MIHKTTRSILSVLLAALLLVTSVPLTPAFADGGTVSPQSANNESRELTGTGTEGDPYQIATANDLRDFAKLVNEDGKTTANAILTDDIDLNPGFTFKEDGRYSGPDGEEPHQWTPIGNSFSNKYTGTFNGAGHTISGLYIDSNADYQGLFGYVSTDGDNIGTVQNLSVSGSVKGYSYVGGVAGQNNGNVINCAFSGSVTSSDSPVGGVVGYNDSGGSVTNCYNTGSVTSSDSSVGGVVGWNSGSVTNCYNTGTVSSTSNTSDVGGVVGHNYSGGSVTNSYNTGKVIGSSVGGVVGYNYSGGSVTGCYFLQDTAEKGIGGNDSSAAGATAESVNDLNDQKQFKGWDFDNTWRISKSLNRPVLQDNAQDGLPPGLGTEASPYEISTATELKNFAVAVNNGSEKSAHAKLMNDIDLSSVCGAELSNGTSWEPIGTSSSKPYSGTFDGNGHTISGLYIVSSDNNQGLFGYLSTSGDNKGTVQNLSVSGSVSGHLYVGGIAGQNNGNVINCAFSGSVSGVSLVGGVVGSNGGTVTGCTFSVSGTVSGNSYVGGVVGYNGGNVENCYNTGSVTGVTVVSVSSDYVGGVVGDNGGTVENCYNTGSVKGDWYVGGVVGLNGGTVENCYNTGAVNSSGNRVGGVVGDNGGNVENCYNTGTVNVSGNSSAVGGVVGCNQGGSVQNCYNTGGVNVTGTGNWVGGVVGWNSSVANVTNCYNTGKVSGSYVGGVVGCNDSSASVANCYYQTGKGATVGIGGTTGDNSSQTAAKSLEDFHSGEVAWLLENVQTDGSSQVWGQNIGEDKSPVLTSDQEKTVYRVPVDLNYTGAQADQVIYTNSTLNAKEPTREGYTFDGWYDSNGNPVTAITATTAKLYAHWTAVEDPDPEPEEPPYSGKYSYEISTDIGDNGAISVDRYATEGDTVTIQVAPDQAYKLDELVVTANGKDVELTANSDGTYTFTMPSADVKITATFAEDPDWTEPEPEPSTDVSDLFIDIAPDAWYKDAVQYAYDNGLMTGVSDTEFAPEATTTRAMIVSILARLEGVESAQAAGFTDVDDEWYATAVNWAANVGVVNGYEDNTFQPNTAITREQLAAILMNYAAYKGEDVSNRADLANYTDQPSTWAQEAMQWAVAEGLINGVTNDQLQPQGNATRAQVAAILQRFLEA